MTEICKHKWVKSEIHAYLRCDICGTYTLEKMPDLSVYSQNYWSHDNNRSTLDEQVHNLTWEFDGASKIDKVMKYVKGGDKALEIGCAPGIMLQKLADTHIMAYGIEVDPNNFPDIKRIANRPNVRLWEGFFPYDFFGLKSELFDTAVAMDVLEHSEDPEWFVRKMRDILTNTGTLIVMTPILQPNVFMPARMWNEHEHIWMFSLEHITQIFTTYFHSVTTDSWKPGHEMIIGKNPRR